MTSRTPGLHLPPTTEQVTALGEAMPAELRALVTFAAGTGMRQGEVFGLTVDRLDMLRREVHVDRQLVGVDGLRPQLGPPKTPASLRTIPLPRGGRRRACRAPGRAPD